VVDDREQHDLSVVGRVERKTARCIQRKSLIGPTPRRRNEPSPGPPSAAPLLFQPQVDPLGDRHELLRRRQPRNWPKPALRQPFAVTCPQLLDARQDRRMKPQQVQDVAHVDRTQPRSPRRSALRHDRPWLAIVARSPEAERFWGFQAALAVGAPGASRGSEPRGAGSCFRRHWCANQSERLAQRDSEGRSVAGTSITLPARLQSAYPQMPWLFPTLKFRPSAIAHQSHRARQKPRPDRGSSGLRASHVRKLRSHALVSR
jgi:hypothetical protein